MYFKANVLEAIIMKELIKNGEFVNIKQIMQNILKTIFKCLV